VNMIRNVTTVSQSSSVEGLCSCEISITSHFVASNVFVEGCIEEVCETIIWFEAFNYLISFVLGRNSIVPTCCELSWCIWISIWVDLAYFILFIFIRSNPH
jgi:hypothetical protein